MRPRLETWLESRLDLVALTVVAIGLLIRAWIASRTFLYPDEALHYVLANQPSAILAYKASLTNAHPPLFFLLLYFWRFLGNSEFVLRVPSVLAGAALPWVVFRWLGYTFDRRTGFIGLLLVTFSPVMISLSAEVRGYAFLLLCLAGVLYFLERAFEEQSRRMMLLSFVALYLAILTHYSTLWFALAVAAYSLIRILGRQLPGRVVKLWAGLQFGAAGIYAFLYLTHISKLRGSGIEQEAMSTWLQRFYFHAGEDSVLPFAFRRTIAAFAYVFAQRELGIAMLLLFCGGVGLLLLRHALPGRSRLTARALGVLLLLPFVIGAGAAIAGFYPSGGSRHTVFLALFATAGVSLLLARWAGSNAWPRWLSAGLILLVITVSTLHGSPEEMIGPQNRGKTVMRRAVSYIQQSVAPGGLIFADYESSVMLGYYLGKDQLIRFDTAQEEFMEFPYGGYRVVAPYIWSFTPTRFASEFDRMASVYRLNPEEPVWVVRAGLNPELNTELVKGLPGFNCLAHETFSKNIAVLKVNAVSGGSRQ